MNNLKRLISLLLCMTFLFASVGVFAEDAVTEEVVATEATVTEEAPEVEPIEIDWESIGLLEALGIIDEVDPSTAQEFLTAQFSRAEFAVALLKFNNMADAVGVGKSFNDVVPGSKEEPYINAAVDMGLIAAVSDGYFYPQYPISYQDAAQALVMSLGYSAVAEINDSWLIQAKKLGIMKGVDTGSAFTRAQAYRMIFNALHAEVMEITTLEGKYASYEAREGVDALYRFFDIRHDEGIIMSAGGVDLSTGTLASSTEYIKVNGKQYYYGQHDLNEYLGRNVVVYYNDNNDAVYVLLDSNEELVLPASEMINYANYTYTYGDNKKTAKIAAPPTVILNGAQYRGEYVESIMKPDAGSVTLVDNNHDSVYDVVFIKSYTDHVVKNKLKDPDRILDYLGNEINVDLDSKNIYVYNKDGGEMKYESIAAGNVVSIAASSSVVNIYISTDTVSGSISQMSTKYGKDVWRIGDVDYTPSQTLSDAIAAGNTRLEQLSMGKNYKFYLNIYGEIVYYEEAVAVTGDDKFYAFVTAAKMEGIDNNELTLKVFAKTFGGFESLTVPKRITLNGSNATPAKVYESLKRDGVDGRVSSDGRIIAQPVIIKVNENNEITYLSQAGVADYYKTVYNDKPCTQSIYDVFSREPQYTAPDPSITPEFELYMGDYRMSGDSLAYRDVLELGIWKQGSNAWNYEAGQPYVKKDEGWNYDTPTNDNKCFRHIGMADDIQAYQVPYYKTGSNAGTVAAEKEDFFKSAGISTNTKYVMYAYREGDSLECSYMTIVQDASAASTVGIEFNLQVVVEVTRAYINEAPVTQLKTNTQTVYIEDGVIDLNNVQRYDYTENTMYEADGVTPLTYSVKPGDIVNIKIDSLGYATAVEAVYDSTNQRFLADSDGYTSAGVQIAENANRTASYYAKRGTPDYRISKVSVLEVDGGTLEGVMGDAATYNPATDKKVLTMVPNSLIKVENVRDKITTANATTAELISYEDSTSEYVTILLVSRYLALSGASFLYPHQ